MKLRVGTRGSSLSLAQTKIVIDLLKKTDPHLDIEVQVIKTLGDREVKKPLYQLNEKGIFEKEIDKALLEGLVDFAVHSFKDVPTSEPEGLIVAATPKRASPNDVLVSKEGKRLKELKLGSILGTSSLRRMAQVKRVRLDIDVRPIRGNEENRVKKVLDGDYDATILAQAGLQRIGLDNHISEVLPLEEFPPSAGQGALAVMARKDDKSIINLLQALDDKSSRAEVEAERSFTSKIEGGCRVPLGVIAKSHSNVLRLRASVYSVDGRITLTSILKGHIEEARKLGLKAADEMLRKGASSIMEEWRKLYPK